MNSNQKAYWHNYYHADTVVETDSAQRNVGRTLRGTPITEAEWKKTIQYIESIIDLKKTDRVVELCCGNGMVIGHLADKCNEAIGIDYSNQLLEQLKQRFSDKVKTLLSDVLEVNLEEESNDIVIIYFSIQHFDNADAVRIIETAFRSLRKSGRLFIGDIPNELKKWDYIAAPEYRKDFIQRMRDHRPLIGNWFHPEFFSAIACYLGNASVKLLEQPDFLINSAIRFDIIFTKKT